MPLQSAMFQGAWKNRTWFALRTVKRRDLPARPVLQLPDKSVVLHPALRAVLNDVDLLRTTLDRYARNR